MHFRYHAYGLNIASNRHITGLFAQAFDAPDLTIAFRPADNLLTDLLNAQEWHTRYRLADAFAYSTLTETTGVWHRLWYFDNGHTIEFLIDPDLRHASVFWSPRAPYQDVMVLTRTNLLGSLVRLRGILGLHADVLAVHDRGIAIMGVSGAGKSTTTAALSTRGCAILSDDVAVLHETEGEFLALPTAMQLRLWRPSADKLQLQADALPRVFARSEKRLILLDAHPHAPHRFHSQPLPLAAIYLLTPRDAARAAASVRALSPSAGFLALSQNSINDFLVNRAQRTREFQTLGRLAARVPVREILRPDSLDLLPQVVDTMLEDVKSLRE